MPTNPTIATLARDLADIGTGLAVLQERVDGQDRAAQQRHSERKAEAERLSARADASEKRISELEGTLDKLRFSGRALLGLLTVVSTISGFVGALLQRLH